MSKEYKDYGYITKAVPLPGGGRKFIRAKSKRELDRKVLEFQLSLAQQQPVVVAAGKEQAVGAVLLWLGGWL